MGRTLRRVADAASELLAFALRTIRRDGRHRLTWRTRHMRARVDLEDKDAVFRELDESPGG